MKKLYAAYGSNLHRGQMALRCPDAEAVGTAQLRGYELVFRGWPHHGVATIEPRPGGVVPILLWEISKGDELSLDRYEGWPNLYRKQTLELHMGEAAVSAMAYVMTPGHQPGVPSTAYYNTIREGYRDCGFDPSVLEDALARSEVLARQAQRQGGLWRIRFL